MYLRWYLDLIDMEEVSSLLTLLMGTSRSLCVRCCKSGQDSWKQFCRKQPQCSALVFILRITCPIGQWSLSLLVSRLLCFLVATFSSLLLPGIHTCLWIHICKCVFAEVKRIRGHVTEQCVTDFRGWVCSQMRNVAINCAVTSGLSLANTCTSQQCMRGMPLECSQDQDSGCWY